LEWYRRTLAGREKVFGVEYPGTLDTVHDIALVLHEQGKYEDALEWDRRALAGKEKVLGAGHPDTLDTVTNIALVFDHQGKFEDALQWYRRALAGSKKLYSEGHPAIIAVEDDIRRLERSRDGRQQSVSSVAGQVSLLNPGQALGEVSQSQIS